MYTHSGTVGQRMTGAVMRETETLYSALGKKGRMGAGGSEGGMEGEVFGIASLPPFHSLLCLPVSLFLSTHPTLPTLPLPNLQRCTLVWNMGVRAHTHSKFARVCVCGLVKWQNGAEASQTCM